MDRQLRAAVLDRRKRGLHRLDHLPERRGRIDGQFATANALAVHVQGATDIPDSGIHSPEIEVLGPRAIEGRLDLGEFIDVPAEAISLPFRNRNQRALAIGHGGRIGGGRYRKLAARDGPAGHQEAREGLPVAVQQRKFAFHQVDDVVEIGELPLGGCDPLREQIGELPKVAGLRAQFQRGPYRSLTISFDGPVFKLNSRRQVRASLIGK